MLTIVLIVIFLPYFECSEQVKLVILCCKFESTYSATDLTEFFVIFCIIEHIISNVQNVRKTKSLNGLLAVKSPPRDSRDT